MRSADARPRGRAGGGGHEGAHLRVLRDADRRECSRDRSRVSLAMSRELDTRAELLLEARYPILYFVSWEEERLMRRIEKLAENLQSRVVTWSVSQGMRDEG